MSKPTRIWAQFKPCEDETYAASVTIGNDYPDALLQAENTVTRIMDHMIDHAAQVYGDNAEPAATD